MPGGVSPAHLGRMIEQVPAALIVDLLRPGDRTSVVEVFEGLSPQSRRNRFLAPVPRLTGRMLTVLSDVGGWRQVAVAGRLRGRCIGLARAVRPVTGPRDAPVAELAIEVADAYHRRGVGRRLVDELAVAAWNVGIREFSAVVHPHNAAALGFVRAMGAWSALDDDGLVRVGWRVPPAASA
jgi:ribosomal protein S18 acetylase RimI-like enzyme